MKKQIALLCIAFFTLVSCSSNDDSPIVVPSATTAQAVLDGNSINVTWPVVAGTGITYNIYRNDNPVKINSTPLTEAKFTDVLTTTGAFTYTVTVNLSGQESPKGIASEKVVLEVPKTRTFEVYNYDVNNVMTTEYKSFSTFTYDPINITKLISVSSTYLSSGSTTPTEDNKDIYTYTGNLITKLESVDKAGVVQSSTVYLYNDKNKMISLTNTQNVTFIYRLLFDYNVDGIVSSTEYMTFSGVLEPSGRSNVYTVLNGNLIKEESSIVNIGSPLQTSTIEYSLDTKKNPFSNVLGFSNYTLWWSNQNNEISSVSNNNTSSTVHTTRNEITYNLNGSILINKLYTKSGTNPEKLSSINTYTY
ncbi:hypothetical protein [Flavobacterium sp. M31R6]|uniref:hypothetical protein n=1 Tax=Flavobacterium sp. M31R6 TaxID=2739062 RepID=UPI001569C1A4|nr:hypothetical protein [Flavobacterium sp. M31R6]QKJ63544.1 hypothetical protein HQN62_10525 [Flavobacterium sp. M31R6]